MRHEIPAGLYWEMRFRQAELGNAQDAVKAAQDAVKTEASKLREVFDRVEQACEGVNFDRTYTWHDSECAIEEKGE